MAFIEWSDDLSVRIPEIDDQHKKLILIINALNEIGDERADARATGKALVEMMDYMSYHFTYEERILMEAGYPEMDAHQGEHKAFSKKTYAYLESFKKRNSSLSKDMLRFLNDWLINHIKAVDGKYADFMADKLAGASKPK